MNHIKLNEGATTVTKIIGANSSVLGIVKNIYDKAIKNGETVSSEQLTQYLNQIPIEDLFYLAYSKVTDVLEDQLMLLSFNLGIDPDADDLASEIKSKLFNQEGD